ncbi:phosphatase PAP2 family protein [Lentzea sp. NBC_00516]|uniref:phosphatase PAP2 family protein n=1 Tax=Lentzea sp. NBC_00516 TaxID=2903582 RepID=UPI002E7FF34B|nr:phosphatase PAP2 family protein [Lentzea sp. NBC_00516]WUD26032.1 phosphatase PAP2 family protein [Lentzea sp. NBC_00516]
MTTAETFDRRSLLRRSAMLSAALLIGPAALDRALEASAAELPTGAAPFVDSYRTNVPANLTPETNAAVRALSGMQDLWRTGSTWDNGVVLRRDVLTANIRHCARITSARTADQAKRAFIVDRQHQSYSAIGGLGPLADLYKAGAKAVTGITSAPDGTPPSTVEEKLPPDAPAGSALGAGSPDSALGQVVLLVNTLRGPFASGNPSKYAYQYPRPWRMTPDSSVVPTGETDEFGYPVYRSEVLVAPQLLRQRNLSPVDDAGYPSGHTNALHLACLALAYAVPERFQELVTRAFDLADMRIVAGMHSPADVIGGRILATALAAATLADPQNATLKAAARTQASEYLRQRTGADLFAYAHSAGISADPYADREVNAALVAPRLAYGLPSTGRRVPMAVPKGAEVLLETRLPYLGASQRREVLRTTGLPSGHALLDGPEQWGRLNLFAAADGFGAFDSDVRVEMDANRGGFHAADTWHNAIGGDGGLVKRGSGTLTLAGANGYTGGTRVEGGTLVAASPSALGRGDVDLRAGTLRLTDQVRVRGYRQRPGTTLAVTGRQGDRAALAAVRPVTLSFGSRLEISLEDVRAGAMIPVLTAPVLLGRFSRITVEGSERRVQACYSPTGLSLRVLS